MPQKKKKKRKKLLSQNLNSLQTKVDFDEPSDFNVFGGKVPLLTEHLLAAALVNRLENESECEDLITSGLACKKPKTNRADFCEGNISIDAKIFP